MKEVALELVIASIVMHHSFIIHSLVGGKTLGDYQPAFRRTLNTFLSASGFLHSISCFPDPSAYLEMSYYYFS